ncbi:hypothetical protein [Dasania marina]|uniref:transglycosylase SLT domain-containing protein n=1 Tax=Dasania marina TaxID=471499 RepID=UPI0030DDD1E6|tara:strand:- start:29530 stop:30141 length:612 start_codon:yes stop_codon:yes gene_type:complete
MTARIAILSLLTGLLFLTGCTTAPPKNLDNVCEMFREKDDWYEDAADARENWGSSIGTMMAMMHQESRFRAKAQPPREWLLGIIPWFRASSAYGYSQAKDGTWEDYQRGSGNYGADRDDFDDAIDFIGWYNSVSMQRCNIKRDDTYHLYLAYHEGQGGFNRRTFKNKGWLKVVAKKVSARARRYNGQLSACEESLKEPWWYLF